MKRTILSSLLLLLATIAPAATVLTQAMVDKARTSLTLTGEYTLDGATVVLPRGFNLIFRRGTLNGGTLEGTRSTITADPERVIFGSALKITGTWRVRDIYDKWFWIRNDDTTFVANQTIRNILALADDDVPNHIHFSAGRTYYFGLFYNGQTNIGDLHSYTMEGETKRRRYGEVFDSPFSDLRIFTIPSNTHVTLDATLSMLGTHYGAYFVFWEKDKENITIDGEGHVSGDNLKHRHTHVYVKGTKYYGEWGHVLTFVRCKNVTIRDITVSDAFGDCILFNGSYSREDTSPRWAEGLTMTNVKVLRARRNGVTLAARNCRIDSCLFKGNGTVNGTFPKSGIDFEADYLDDYHELGNENVWMTNCTFEDNVRDIAASNNNLPGYGKVATTVVGCTFPTGIRISWGNWLRFEDCTIGSFIGAWGKPIDGSTAIKNTEFIRCRIMQMPRIMQNAAWNNKFRDCQVDEYL